MQLFVFCFDTVRLPSTTWTSLFLPKLMDTMIRHVLSQIIGRFYYFFKHNCYDNA